MGQGSKHPFGNASGQQSHALREQAERCRRLAQTTYDRETSKMLSEMASRFDKTADELARRQDQPLQASRISR